jgi:autotransporter-associated beta strand protein
VNIRNLNAGSTLNITGEISGSMGGANLFVRGSSGPINITGGINIQDDAELYFTEGVRIRLGAAGKTYTGFRTTIANNSQVRTLVNNALPVNQQVTIGEASNNNVSKLILGEGSTPVQQTIAGLVVNNTFAGSCIVGGATTNSTLTLDLRGNVNYTLPFGGAAANENNLNIVKTGIGTLTLSSGTTHVGTTTVSGGTLLVNGTSTSSAFIVQSGGTLGGIGTTGSITASGPAGRIAPGNAAIGTLTAFGAVQLGNDSGIDWQVGNWTGTAGSGFDLLNAGSLSITATAVNPVVIRVSEATLSNFTEANKSFTLVQTSAGVTGFAANKFVFDKTGFTGTGSFAARQDGNNLVIDYSVAPAGGNFASWAADNGVTGGADGDSDKDGIKNLIEYALNLNPAASDGAAGSFTGGTLSFSKRALAVSNGDVSYAIQTSTTLDSWSPATPTTNTDSEITLLLPKVQPKLFARLVVTQNP